MKRAVPVHADKENGEAAIGGAVTSSAERDRFLAAISRDFERHRYVQARKKIEKRLRAESQSVDALFIFALVCMLEDDYAQSLKIALSILACDTDIREAADLLSVLYGLAGDLHNAVYYAKLAVCFPGDEKRSALASKHVPSVARVLSEIEGDALLLRARRAMELGRNADAEHWLRQHLEFWPQSRDGYVALTACLLTQGRIRAAADVLRAARHRLPADAALATLLGKMVTLLGRFAEGEALHRHAIALAPDHPSAHAARLIDALSDPARDKRSLQQDFRSWSQRFGLAGGKPVAARHGAPRVLGVVIGEGTDAAARAVCEIIRLRERNDFRIIGFGFGSNFTDARLLWQKSVDDWRDVGDVDALTFATMVEADEPDILLTLVGHTQGPLLQAFGRRMAPLQVAWTSAPYLTGLEAMDAVLSDDFVQSDEIGLSEVNASSSERFATLSLGSAQALLPRQVSSATVHRESDALFFAASATLAELDPETVSSWAEILLRVPDATLVLFDHDFQDPENTAELIARFGSFGVADRVDISAAGRVGELFAGADVALLPLNASFSEIAMLALAEGIPPICFAGPSPHRRLAASSLHYAKLDAEVVAHTREAYVQCAVEWGLSSERRARFRTTLPERLASAPNGNLRARAKDLFETLVSLWRRAQSETSSALEEAC